MLRGGVRYDNFLLPYIFLHHNEEEAFNKAKELMYHKAVHICDNGHIGVGVFTGFERVDIGD